jgi:hypothetical protein
VLAEWKMSANNRRARFYTLTTVGRRPLDVEASRFSQMFAAIKRVMKTTKCPDSQEGVVGAVLRRDLEGELRVHEERKARALADADGMNDDEARAVARRRMGNSLRLFEQSRNHGASRC